MDCIQWVHTSLEMDPGKDIDLILDDIYHNYSIYRTIIICRNEFSMRECNKSLSTLNLPVLQLKSIWDLEAFHRSSYRILLIPFHVLYTYRYFIFKVMIDNNYLVIFNDLLSLQEQFCIDMLKKYIPPLNYYIYIN